MIPKPPTRRFSLEALIWLSGLVILAFIAYTPAGSLQLPSVCLSQAFGFGECFGCGLGASIGHALKGEVAESWAAHPMGMVTLAVLVGRIFTLQFHSRKST